MIYCLHFADYQLKSKIPRHRVRYKEQCINEAIFGNKAAQERPMDTRKQCEKAGGPLQQWDGWPAVPKAPQPSHLHMKPKFKGPIG
jgi:hypothetical protein